jgi:1-hydroxycarotenoid 3,4-desaturase
MKSDRVLVIGAGVGGLAAAISLAARGLDVTVLERASGPGGKVRRTAIGSAFVDAGPTVFTMRWVFDELFAEANSRFGDYVRLQPLAVLARHSWGSGETLDLFADVARSADAIGNFSGAVNARGYLRFCDRARRIYQTVEHSFLRRPQPSLTGLILGAGLNVLTLRNIAPFTTMWSALSDYFTDPRLRQLFGRYATYCGSSPFLAPATLMLVAHVEQEGVFIIEGGMYRLVSALIDLAAARGVKCRYESEVDEITVEAGRATGAMLASGERLDADAIIFNGDVSALASGMLGGGARDAVAVSRKSTRSLSAVTYAMIGDVVGFPLVRHNVFFSPDYAAEFADLFTGCRLPAEPTVYVCAQDRGDEEAAGSSRSDGGERIFCLVNAPPVGDARALDSMEIERCEERTFRRLERCGLHLRQRSERKITTTPREFSLHFPATGGALYGQASHGWEAAFSRPGCGTRLPGLYVAGGSTHPGPGVPMAALSGRMAASSLLSDLTSRGRFRLGATPGGMSTR